MCSIKLVCCLIVLLSVLNQLDCKAFKNHGGYGSRYGGGYGGYDYQPYLNNYAYSGLANKPYPIHGGSHNYGYGFPNPNGYYSGLSNPYGYGNLNKHKGYLGHGYGHNKFGGHGLFGGLWG